jgi:hypothetical protein
MLKIVAILKSLPHHACAEEIKGMKKGQLSYHGSIQSTSRKQDKAEFSLKERGHCPACRDRRN